ncbi:MAG TPA: hypothetical protein VNM14_10920 [Planctomycetota bacterium]|jgi:hypothetical protein|nr:hypothetical protein [Planctomycetota bacterium]
MIIRALVPALLSLAVLLGAAAQEKFKSIKEAMTATHKGDDSLVKKVQSGKGSDEDHKKLLEVYEFISTQKPSKGDEASWKAKTSALVAAMKDVAEKKAGATETFKKASDCKGCHSVHKGK